MCSQNYHEASISGCKPTNSLNRCLATNLTHGEHVKCAQGYIALTGRSINK